jgi:hypothetical protein
MWDQPGIEGHRAVCSGFDRMLETRLSRRVGVARVLGSVG